ncbi:MAG TPA: hypothetical protein VKO66_06135 [Sideroxyarcus sp.]|nr:hypothetical protein [Sideroxyarcus sp.]
MKKIIIIALLTLLPLPSQALDLDKKQHILFSVLTFGTTYVVTKDVKTSVLVGLGVGLAKEIYDSKHKNGDGFDTHDLAADAVGVGLGVLWVRNF